MWPGVCGMCKQGNIVWDNMASGQKYNILAHTLRSCSSYGQCQLCGTLLYYLSIIRMCIFQYSKLMKKIKATMANWPLPIVFCCLPPVASFTKKVNPWLAKCPLKTNWHLTNHALTSVVKEATGVLCNITHNKALLMESFLWRLIQNNSGNYSGTCIMRPGKSY